MSKFFSFRVYKDRQSPDPLWWEMLSNSVPQLPSAYQNRAKIPLLLVKTIGPLVADRCPFEKEYKYELKIFCFKRQGILMHIPALCALNPAFKLLMTLRMRFREIEDNG